MKNIPNWKKLHEKFFAECTEKRTYLDNGCEIIHTFVCMAPHDLFEWFKKQLNENISENT